MPDAGRLLGRRRSCLLKLEVRTGGVVYKARVASSNRFERLQSYRPRAESIQLLYFVLDRPQHECLSGRCAKLHVLFATDH